MNVITAIRNWSEVWALLIPLTIAIHSRFHIDRMSPIIIYVLAAFVLNSISTTMFVFHDQMPQFLKNNNIFYNIHSFLRVILFSYYIYHARNHRYSVFYKIVISTFILFAAINFIFFETILLFSSRLFAGESVVLLIFCLTFFWRSMQDESYVNWLKDPAFLVCIGVLFYEAVNFFIFLLYYPLSYADADRSFIRALWTLHNITFVILNLALAMSLYWARKNSPSHQSLPQ